jgi:nucleotide-binding universal stress UspA family protein
MILICYDGSADAKAAIEHAGRLLRHEPATVVTVWEPIAQVLARSPSPGIAPMAGLTHREETDDLNRSAAEGDAADGTELARRVGFDAKPLTCPLETTIADAILTVAGAVDAVAIVMGSRGLTGLKSLLLGSVSHAVIQHADRAVIVVPSAEVAASRQQPRRALR